MESQEKIFHLLVELVEKVSRIEEKVLKRTNRNTTEYKTVASLLEKYGTVIGKRIFYDPRIKALNKGKTTKMEFDEFEVMNLIFSIKQIPEEKIVKIEKNFVFSQPLKHRGSRMTIN
jgi:hypothetical protein